jgi:NADH-quinone oxidoreductase subunit M
MGFVLLGLATLNLIGMSGAILQMFSHGIVASLLFAVVGRMVYDRTHTRQLDELGGLAKVIPFACVTFVIAGAASMGMPGFSGFVAEYQIFVGAFHMHPVLALAAGLSIPLTVAYILNANDKVFMEQDPPAGDSGHGHGQEESGDSPPALPPITLPERVAAMILMALLVIVGVYPSIMLNMIKANVQLFLRGAP